MKQYRTCYQLNNGEWHPELLEYKFTDKKAAQRHIEETKEYFATFTETAYPLKIQSREVGEWEDETV